MGASEGGWECKRALVHVAGNVHFAQMAAWAARQASTPAEVAPLTA